MVQDIAAAIRRYVHDHPDAADSIDGIHRWWLVPALRDEAPRRVEAAVAQLARAQCLMPVVRAMPEAFCEQLGRMVASTFAVGEWPATAATAATADADRAVHDASPAVDGARSPVQPRIVAAIRPYASVDFAALAPAQRALVGLSLLIARAPAVARSAGVVAVLRSHDRWWSSGDGAPTVTTVRPHPALSDAHFGARHARHAIMPQQAQPSARDEASVLPGAPLTVRAPSPEPATHGSQESGSTGQPVVPLDAWPRDQQRLDAAVEDVPRMQPVDEDLPVRVVDSEFAGIVYVVNPALHLELYGDFTQPARPGLELPLGDFLALVGERVVGAAFVADPVWPLLAELAGREPFDPPGGTGDRRHLQRRVDEWTSGLAECTAEVLGMERSAALPFLCGRAGRLALSATRFDTTFELAAHPLAIRMACLDRDPGWVPAAGRTIAFHYE